MRRIFIILSASLIFSNCEMIVEVDLPEHTPVLVVNSPFSPSDDWLVRVNHSVGILENDEIEPVRNATVEIITSSEQRYFLSRSNDGYYYNSALAPPQAGQTYRLHVSAPGYTDVTAESHVPLAVPIDSVKARWLNFAGDDEVELTVYFTDPAEQENYYQLSVMQGTGDFLEFESDDLIFGNSGGNTFTDDLIDGKVYGLKIRIDAWQFYSSSFDVMLLSASEEFYKYFTSYSQYEDTDENPFAEPVFVFNNIENGLGIFAGFNMAHSRIIISE